MKHTSTYTKSIYRSRERERERQRERERVVRHGEESRALSLSHSLTLDDRRENHAVNQGVHAAAVESYGAGRERTAPEQRRLLMNRRLSRSVTLSLSLYLYSFSFHVLPLLCFAKKNLVSDTHRQAEKKTASALVSRCRWRITHTHTHTHCACIVYVWC